MNAETTAAASPTSACGRRRAAMSQLASPARAPSPALIDMAAPAPLAPSDFASAPAACVPGAAIMIGWVCSSAIANAMWCVPGGPTWRSRVVGASASGGNSAGHRRSGACGRVGRTIRTVGLGSGSTPFRSPQVTRSPAGTP
jgi:hypothetical protein